MSDIFAPPPAETTTRTKPPLCGAVDDALGKCSLYRNHAADFHRDQHRHTAWAVTTAPTEEPPALPAPTTWHHSRKGRITGHLVSLDETWARIRIVGDHELRMAVQDGHRDDGEIITVRASFLTPTPTAEEVVP